jgi:hypothetical protein
MRRVTLQMYVTTDGFANFPNYPGSGDPPMSEEEKVGKEMWIKNSEVQIRRTRLEVICSPNKAAGRSSSGFQRLGRTPAVIGKEDRHLKELYQSYSKDE